MKALTKRTTPSFARAKATLLACSVALVLSACSGSDDHIAKEAKEGKEAEVQKPAGIVEAIKQEQYAVSKPVQAKPHGQMDPHVNLGPDKYAMVALGHLDEGRISEAMDTINSALKQHPDAANLFTVRSQIYSQQSQPALALADLEKAVSLAPDDALLYVNRAAIYSRFDRDDQAMEDLNQAISLSPDLLAARFNRGSLRFIQEDLTGALEDFEHCIAVDPHAAAPYFNRAAVLDATGERAKAIQDMERFLQLAQEGSWKEAGEALLKQWQGDTENAGLSSDATQANG